MPQIFRPRANAIARMVLVLVGVAVPFLAVGATLAIRSDGFTGVNQPVEQPIPFSHEHHAEELGIDCRYCHTSVETSASAGLPSTEICMTCHSQIWTNADVLAPLRQSLATNTPIQWNRVNDLADFVYFNHAAHVNNGVACVTCHGPIGDMALTFRANPMQMSWCLGCHTNPAPNLSPPDAIFAALPQPTAGGDGGAAAHQALMQQYGIDPKTMTDCYVCHR